MDITSLLLFRGVHNMRDNVRLLDCDKKKTISFFKEKNVAAVLRLRANKTLRNSSYQLEEVDKGKLMP